MGTPEAAVTDADRARAMAQRHGVERVDRDIRAGFCSFARQRRHTAWDAALRPAQRRAELGRARLQQRKRAEARRQRLIAAWLRKLAEETEPTSSTASGRARVRGCVRCSPARASPAGRELRAR